MRRGRRLALAALAAAAGAALLWTGAFLRPVPAAPPGPPADGAVVLTGGAGRVEAGLRLLEEGAAPRLLVSGVFDLLDDADFLRRWPEAGPSLACCITLGREARDTRGNALETAAWARDGGRRRLLLVTSDFHMRRALMEHRRALPEAEFIPVPVETRPRRRLLRHGLVEALKYPVARLGLAPPPAPGP